MIFNDLASYIAENYGRCICEPCKCRTSHEPWIGRGCLHWLPSRARNWDELAAEVREARR